MPQNQTLIPKTFAYIDKSIDKTIEETQTNANHTGKEQVTFLDLNATTLLHMAVNELKDHYSIAISDLDIADEIIEKRARKAVNDIIQHKLANSSVQDFDSRRDMSNNIIDYEITIEPDATIRLNKVADKLNKISGMAAIINHDDQAITLEHHNNYYQITATIRLVRGKFCVVFDNFIADDTNASVVREILDVINC